MKIAVIHAPLWGRGGAERQVLKLAIELQRFGNEVKVFTPFVSGETCYPELIKQLDVKQLPYNPLIPFRRSNAFSASSDKLAGEIAVTRNRLQRILVNEFYTVGLPSMIRLGRIIPKGFDIINNHNAYTEWAAFTAKRKLKVPVVWMCNEPPSWFYSAHRGIRSKLVWPLFEVWDKATVRYVDEIMVLSHVAEELVKNAYGRSSRIVRTGIDAGFFANVSGKEMRRANGWENDLILLQVANMAPFKKQHESIIALSFLAKKYDNVKLVLDGSGPKEWLIRLTEKMGLTGRVVFRHSKSDSELAQVYAACDVFVFPPKMTWGLAVVEAMASSKPVVVSGANGVAEIIQDGVTGMIFDHEKPMQMAKDVELLIDNPQLRAHMGRKACDYVKANLSWEKFSRSVQDLLEAAVLTHEKNN